MEVEETQVVSGENKAAQELAKIAMARNTRDDEDMDGVEDVTTLEDQNETRMFYTQKLEQAMPDKSHSRYCCTLHSL